MAVWGAGQTGKPWLRWLLEEGFRVPYVIEVSPRKIGKTIHGTPVISPDQLPDARQNKGPILAAVGAAGARAQIASHLETLGYRAGEDVWYVA